jgi:predicted NBD/HSP70 family sugar kinase
MNQPLTGLALTPKSMTLAEILRQPGVSRSVIARRANLNLATISRLTRDLIDADLIKEISISEGIEDRRPGRPFVGLKMNGTGGFIIGIGINAFRQSVTLADLENRKLDEWVSPSPPKSDGDGFLRLCLEQADVLLQRNAIPRDRFFGVGLAVAAQINAKDGVILSAPTFGWEGPINVGRLSDELLGAPLAIETPSIAMTLAEAEFGQAQDAESLMVLHCSLGFGLGMRKGDGHGMADFGRVLTQAKSASDISQPLDAMCAGVSVLNEAVGATPTRQMSDVERGQELSKVIAKAKEDRSIAELLCAKGALAAQHFSLTIDILSPQTILLAGPLAQSPDYVAGFEVALRDALDRGIDIGTTDMTPPGASRWLSLRANVVHGNIDLSKLQTGVAA